VPDPEPCPDPCLVVLIKVKVHPCPDLNFAGSRQKNGLWKAEFGVFHLHPGKKIRDGKQGSGSDMEFYYGKLILTINEFNLYYLNMNTF
jgi:hypothetical protein